MPPRAAANGRGAYSANGARASSSTNGAVNANGATKPPMDAVEHELLRRLLASPEWGTIRAALHARLNEAGWVDELYIRGTARTANSLTSVTVQDLLDHLGPHAHAAVPAHVKQEIMGMIRAFLDRQVAS
ncbi:hypothetical protein K523DRAFT_306757, partial [Schizophyllum commune Tattone D]